MKDKQVKNAIGKSSALYITMLFVWSAIVLLLWWNFIPKIKNVPFFKGDISLGVQIGARVLLLFNGLFISYFWLNGVKDFLYVIWYYLLRKRFLKRI